MRLVLLCLLAIALLVGCQRTPQMDSAAYLRLRYIEQTGNFSHTGWYDTIQPYHDPTVCIGEVLARDTSPLTPLRSYNLWLASPEHRDILSERIIHWGYAQSGSPHGGWYYAVAEVEWYC